MFLKKKMVMSSLLLNVILVICQLCLNILNNRCSDVTFNLLIRSWCLQLPIAGTKDTHPIISQNGFDVICFKTG